MRWGLLEELPRFAVLLVSIAIPLGFADGAEHQVVAFGFEDDGRWEDVPDIFGDDVGGKEVDGFGGVALATAVGFEGAEIAVADAEASGFDLNFEKAAAGFDGDVVGGGVSPGLEDSEVLTQGLRDELDFDPLAALFEILEAFALCHRFCLVLATKEKAQPWGCALVILKIYII